MRPHLASPRARAHAPARSVGLTLPPVLLIGALSYAGLAQGAFHPSQLRLLTLLLAAAALAAVWRSPLSRDDVRLPPVLACAAVAAWSIASAVLAGEPSGAVQPLELLGCLVAVIIVVRRLDDVDRSVLVAAAVGVGGVVALTGWVGAVVRRQPYALLDGGLWRSASTITYANGTAAFLGLTALIALARLAAKPGVWWRLGAFASLVTLGTTLSRTGIVAFSIGVVVLFGLLGWRSSLPVALPVFAGAALAVAAAIPGLPAAGPRRPLVAAVGLAVGCGLALGGDRVPRLAPAVLIAASLAMVAIVVWGGAAISGRVTVDSPDRHHEWTAALAVARRHPVVGVGPTKAVFSWTAPDGTLMAVAYAHNELLQVLSTEGAVGLGVVVIGLLSIGRWVQRRLSVVPRWVGASTVSAAVTAAVGAATDFVWHIPLIPVLGAVLVALTAPCALTPDRSSGPAERQAACDTDDD